MQRLGFAARQTLVLAASTMTTLALAPKTVILVRHGAVNREAAGLTPDGLYGGDVDVPLSERGEAEARAAAHAAREEADALRKDLKAALDERSELAAIKNMLKGAAGRKALATK